MPYVNFVTDIEYEDLVKKTLSLGKGARKKAEDNFDRNIIDPFSILWEMASFNSDYKSWHASEISRQAQKTLSNQIGMFHQKFLGLVQGWKDLDIGQQVDLVNRDRKIIAEIKNKHNTVTGAKKVNIYETLENCVMPNGHKYKGYTAYYVEIIPKKPERTDAPFTPSNSSTSTKSTTNEKIRQIDGASFYALVTGVDDALEQVFNTLPDVIKKVSSQLDQKSIKSAKKFFNKAYILSKSNES